MKEARKETETSSGDVTVPLTGVTATGEIGNVTAMKSFEPIELLKQQPSQLYQLEREVIERAKEFTDDKEPRANWDALAAYRELCRAVDALIDFESSQHSPPSG